MHERKHVFLQVYSTSLVDVLDHTMLQQTIKERAATLD